MTITVECPSCRARFQVEDENAGKRARCRRCNLVFAVRAAASADSAAPGLVLLDDEPRETRDAGFVSVPETQPVAAEDDTAGDVLAGRQAKKAKAVRARQERLPGLGASARGVMEAAAATRKTLTPAQVLSAFGGKIEPIRPSALYRTWVAIVAMVMVMLPLVYIAIIGLVVAGLCYHAVHHFTVFHTLGGGSAQVAAVIYLVPLFAGATVVIFMLKPLFARPARREKQRVLDPQVEPLLHAFVDGVCASVGAPRPTRIEVSCDVNAGARREGPLLGVFGNELVLLIGLPLAAGLTLKQFAGVLAHEFGHFSQGAGMRLFVLIMTINTWFARVVYDRDSWDEKLAASSTDKNMYVVFWAGLSRLAVWLTRRVLWALMFVGHVVSAFLSRQMETDADRYEARMVGGNVFAETMWCLRVMSLANHGAYTDLASSWQERRMPDNFAKLLLANIPQIPTDVVAASREAMDKGTTRRLDLYPCDKERMAQAEREEPGEGIFHLDGQATDVFSDFDAMAKVVSLDFYKTMVGPEITKDQLYTVAQLVEAQAAAQAAAAAAERFLLGPLGLLTMRLTLAPDYPNIPPDQAAAEQELVEARDHLQEASAARIQAIGRSDEILGRLSLTQYVQIAINAGISIDPSDFDLKTATPRDAQAAHAQAEGELRRIVAECEPFDSAAGRRLTQALAILESGLVADRIPDGPRNP
ncbi:MAG: MJ0042-type zinc finger domain-containing protein [Isosphaerales bacterium]